MVHHVPSRLREDDPCMLMFIIFEPDKR